MYYIDYHTGAGNEWIDGTLDDAMIAADKGAAYTQCDISITDTNGVEVARRRWYGAEYDDTDGGLDDPICFGDFGFYDNWYVMEE